LTGGSCKNILEEFPDVVFLGVAMESLLSDKEVWSGQTRIMAKKGHNFLYDRWIALIVLYEFPKAIFL
jgi:hypothetical protein